MNHSESFKIGFSELLSNKTKTALTMLGIVFGVASVIAMMSIGEGARQETLEQIKLLGTNNIIVKNNTAKISNTTKSFSSGLSTKDIKSIRELVPNIESVVPQKEAIFDVTYKSKQSKYTVVGTTSEFPTTYNASMFEGSYFTKHHQQEYSNVCVIGYGIKYEFFRFNNAVGEKIKIGNDWFRIVGVLNRKNVSSGSAGIGSRNFNKEVYLPIQTLSFKVDISEENTTGRKFFMNRREEVANIIDRSEINSFTVKVTDEKFINETAALIKRIMLRKHYGTEDFEIIVPEEIIAQKQKTQNIFNIVMGAIAGISLLVGGIGIMNIMLANILERTREIGIRRAVGATRLDVLSQFLYEALIISVLGGIIGLILGFVLTSLITSYAEWRTIITPTSVILAFFVAVGTGVGFGSYPAKKAAEKDPIDSLRYE